MKRIIRFAAAVLVALPLFAAPLGKHAAWADSPQGWFMTRAERAQWMKLTSEAEAETFIADFLAKRDPKFAEEIATRVQKADQYFTVGETPGSKALRGKVIILLGPPSSMGATAKPTRSGGRSGSVDMAVGASGDRMGVGAADLVEVDQREAMKAGSVDKIFTLTYGAEQLPTGKGISVVLEVHGVKGTDKLSDKRQLAELNKLFEAVAEASIKNK